MKKIAFIFSLLILLMNSATLAKLSSKQVD